MDKRGKDGNVPIQIRRQLDVEIRAPAPRIATVPDAEPAAHAMEEIIGRV